MTLTEVIRTASPGVLFRRPEYGNNYLMWHGLLMEAVVDRRGFIQSTQLPRLSPACIAADNWELV